MKVNNKIKVGQVVKSLAGRDKGRIFLISKILDSDYVLIIDGDLRKSNKPKKKKIKHLAIYNKFINLLGDNKKDDFYIKEKLKLFR